MAKKQAVVNEKAPMVKKAAPRVKAAKHRTIQSEGITGNSNEIPVENVREAIALTAYSYWESRGRQGGDPTEDWLRAETEIRQHLR
jgi:hypothetical protein